MNLTMKRATGALAAAAALTLALGGNAFASSSHASSSQFQICSQGSYTSYAVFPDTKLPGGRLVVGWGTPTVAPKQCSAAYTLNRYNTTVQIYGIDSSGQSFLIDTDSFDYNAPDHIVTTGSANNPDWHTN